MQKEQRGGFLSESEIAEFAVLLDQYQPSQETVDTFKASNFAVIAGPAGAGKDTLRGKLVGLQPEIYRAVLSTTTRAPRPREIDGVDYHFASKDEVKQGLADGRYLQGAIVHRQQVSTLDTKDFENLGNGQVGLSILVVGTEQELGQYKDDIKTVFLVPPSLEAMKERLSRATRNSDSGEIDRRLKAAKEEITFALGNKKYYCLTTVDKDHTARLVHDFLTSFERNAEEDQAARKTMKGILEGLL